MITPICSKCGKVIPQDNVNVVNDVAYCRACNLAYQLSVLAKQQDLVSGIDLQLPPAGAWYRSEGMGHVIGATHRSFGLAVGALAISLFWNGIVS